MIDSLNRKRQIEELKTIDIESLNPYRNIVIEEVAQAIERMESFGKDTISSFAIYIRSMKN
jgi:hypothetical protein